MKKYIFSLLLGTALCTMTSAFAMDEREPNPIPISATNKGMILQEGQDPRTSCIQTAVFLPNDLWVQILNKLADLKIIASQDHTTNIQRNTFKLISCGFCALVNAVPTEYDEFAPLYKKHPQDFFGQFPNLRTLILRNNRFIINENIQGLTQLTFLDLDDNNTITDASLSYLTNLRSLILGDGTITDASLSYMTNLTSLNLNLNNTITPATLLLLPNLTSLDLARNRSITDASLSDLTQLTSLNLNLNNTITPATLTCLPNLKSLSLAANGTITDASLSYLTNLTSLSLAANGTITSISHLTNLTSLDLVANRTITDDQLRLLPNLTWLIGRDLTDLRR